MSSLPDFAFTGFILWAISSVIVLDESQAAICFRGNTCILSTRKRKTGISFLRFIRGSEIKRQILQPKGKAAILTNDIRTYICLSDIQSTAYADHLTGNITAQVGGEK